MDFVPFTRNDPVLPQAVSQSAEGAYNQRNQRSQDRDLYEMFLSGHVMQHHGRAALESSFDRSTSADGAHGSAAVHPRLAWSELIDHEAATTDASAAQTHSPAPTTARLSPQAVAKTLQPAQQASSKYVKPPEPAVAPPKRASEPVERYKRGVTDPPSLPQFNDAQLVRELFECVHIRFILEQLFAMQLEKFSRTKLVEEEAHYRRIKSLEISFARERLREDVEHERHLDELLILYSQGDYVPRVKANLDMTISQRQAELRELDTAIAVKAQELEEEQRQDGAAFATMMKRINEDRKSLVSAMQMEEEQYRSSCSARRDELIQENFGSSIMSMSHIESGREENRQGPPHCGKSATASQEKISLQNTPAKTSSVWASKFLQVSRSNAPDSDHSPPTAASLPEVKHHYVVGATQRDPRIVPPAPLDFYEQRRHGAMYYAKALAAATANECNAAPLEKATLQTPNGGEGDDSNAFSEGLSTLLTRATQAMEKARKAVERVGDRPM